MPRTPIPRLLVVGILLVLIAALVLAGWYWHMQQVSAQQASTLQTKGWHAIPTPATLPNVHPAHIAAPAPIATTSEAVKAFCNDLQSISFSAANDGGLETNNNANGLGYDDLNLPVTCHFAISSSTSADFTFYEDSDNTVLINVTQGSKTLFSSDLAPNGDVGNIAYVDPQYDVPGSANTVFPYSFILQDVTYDGYKDMILEKPDSSGAYNIAYEVIAFDPISGTYIHKPLLDSIENPAFHISARTFNQSMINHNPPGSTDLGTYKFENGKYICISARCF